MVEYALLIAFVVGIAAYLIYGNNSLGNKIEGSFDNAGTVLDDAQGSAKK